MGWSPATKRWPCSGPVPESGALPETGAREVRGAIRLPQACELPCYRAEGRGARGRAASASGGKGALRPPTFGVRSGYWTVQAGKGGTVWGCEQRLTEVEAGVVTCTWRDSLAATAAAVIRRAALVVCHVTRKGDWHLGLDPAECGRGCL